MTDHDDLVVADDDVGEEGEPDDFDADAALVEAATLDEDLDDVDLPTALAQRDEYLALARQVQADFENFRKRALKQQDDKVAAATGRIVESLLPVLDACDSAVVHGVEGVAPVHRQLLDVLAKAGLDLVATDAGFDPNVHEAVMHEPAEPGDEPSEGPTIVEVLRTGYLWQGRTLRAAMVKVRD